MPSPHTSTRDRLAVGVSAVLNPLLLPPMLFGVLAAYAGAGPGEILMVVGISMTFSAVVPGGYIAWELRQGRVASMDVRDRTRRRRPLLATVASYLTAAAVLSLLPVPGHVLLSWLMVCYGFNTGLTVLVTRYWKISIHALAIAGVPSVLWFMAYGFGEAAVFPGLLPLAGLSAMCIPPVAWARVRLRHHTPTQVIAGTLGGLVLPLAELWLLHAAGLLAFP
ncbi:MAG: hypothetical protein GVY15_01380 [Bacteroidetes bacterium]|nr:hypothetical protein [Bacteroidota bacterium]